jgi:hypothetical protein
MGNLALDSGAFDLKERRKYNELTKKNLYLFEPIPEKFLAIASGATPIGSAERAPDRKETGNKKDEESRLKN